MSSSRHSRSPGTKPHVGETGVHSDPGAFIDFPITKSSGDSLGPAAVSAAIASNTLHSLPSVGGEKKPVKLDRLRAVVELLGFVPSSKDEIRLAIGDAKEPLGFAAYLNKILGHQQYKTTSKAPATALGIKVREAAGYAENARTNVGMLIALKNDLDDRTTLDHMKDWRIQGSTRRALEQVAHSSAAHAALDRGESIVIEDIDVDAIIKAVVEQNNKSNFVFDLEQTDIEQQKRFEYWVKCLQEARSHEAVSDLAVSELRKLGIRIE